MYPIIKSLRLRFLLIVGSGLWVLSAQAQLNFEYTEGKFLIKGQLSSMKTLAAIPYTNVFITNRKKGITTDGEGKFTMYVYPGDTLRFTSVGFISKAIPVNAIPEKERYTISVQLIEDIYNLKSVTIYPFRNRDEFARAFIKGDGVYQPILVPGIAAPTYHHREKANFYSPISAIYNRLKAKKRAADPDFKP